MERVRRYLPIITLIIGMVIGAIGSSISFYAEISVGLNEIKNLNSRMDIVEGLLREIAK